MEIALDLFWRQGFENTSTTQLTASMGISQPSLYAAFGSKEQLYREVLSIYVARYRAEVMSALTLPGAARDAVATMFQKAVSRYTDGRHPSGCLVAVGGLFASAETLALASELTEIRLAGEKAITDRLMSAQNSGELPPQVDVGALAGYFATVLQGLTVQSRDGASADRLRRIADFAMAAWPAIGDR